MAVKLERGGEERERERERGGGRERERAGERETESLLVVLHFSSVQLYLGDRVGEGEKQREEGGWGGDR